MPVRTNRLTDMEYLKVAFSKTGGEPYQTARRTRRRLRASKQAALSIQSPLFIVENLPEVVHRRRLTHI